MTVGDLLSLVEKDYETRKLKSLREVKVHIAPVKLHLGAHKAVSLKSTSAVEDYIATRRIAKKADATIDHELELLSRGFRLAALRGLLPAMYQPSVPRLCADGANARQGFVDRDQLDRLLPELPSQLLRDVALFAYATVCGEGRFWR